MKALSALLPIAVSLLLVVAVPSQANTVYEFAAQGDYFNKHAYFDHSELTRNAVPDSDSAEQLSGVYMQTLHQREYLEKKYTKSVTYHSAEKSLFQYHDNNIAADANATPLLFCF